MKRSGDRLVWAAAISGLLPGAVILAAAIGRGAVFFQHTPIRDLRALPMHSAVHLVGVVTYADGPGNRFWMEDETGAALIPLNPEGAGVHAGETVAVDASKASSYDAAVGPASLVLDATRVHPSAAQVKLPPPYPVTQASPRRRSRTASAWR